MDFATIIGILVALAALGFGYSMDGGVLKALWLLSAFIIVTGGAAGSVAVSYGIKELKKMPGLLFSLFKTPKSNIASTIDLIVHLAQDARKDGLLSIEKKLDDTNSKKKIDPLLKKGMLMVIDGADLEQIKDLLETNISVYEEQQKTNISMFESLAAYAPAYGMIGTIMGLIKVLANMESPEQMAGAIGIAFITTLYGVIIANVIALPASNKLKIRLKDYLLERDMIIEGVCSIRNGQNPKMLRDKLSIYLGGNSKSSKKKSNTNREVG